jgi:heme exporter protein CcmD
MNEGVIRDGWAFVWAAYGVTALILTGYATSVFLRYRSALAKSAPVKP